MNLKTQAEKEAYALGYRTGINRALSELDKAADQSPYTAFSDEIRPACERDAKLVEWAASKNMGMDV